MHLQTHAYNCKILAASSTALGFHKPASESLVSRNFFIPPDSHPDFALATSSLSTIISLALEDTKRVPPSRNTQVQVSLKNRHDNDREDHRLFNSVSYGIDIGGRTVP